MPEESLNMSDFVYTSNISSLLLTLGAEGTGDLESYSIYLSIFKYSIFKIFYPINISMMVF